MSSRQHKLQATQNTLKHGDRRCVFKLCFKRPASARKTYLSLCLSRKGRDEEHSPWTRPKTSSRGGHRAQWTCHPGPPYPQASAIVSSEGAGRPTEVPSPPPRAKSERGMRIGDRSAPAVQGCTSGETGNTSSHPVSAFMRNDLPCLAAPRIVRMLRGWPSGNSVSR